jgi:V/A-type H+/Na+-transporting ATPase subunit I
MIVDIRKFLFYGLSSDLEDFVSKAQETGFIEFIPSNQQITSSSSLNHADIEQAIKILKKLPVVTSYDRYLSKEELLDKALEITSLNKKLEKLQEDLRITNIDIVKLKPLGAFNIDDLKFIYEHTGYKMQFFCKSSVSEKPIDSQLIYIGTEFDLDYFIAISKSKLVFPELIEVKVEHSISECIEHREKLEQAIKHTEKQLKSMAAFLVPLEYALGQYHDLEQLRLTYKMASFPLEAQFFTLTAYVPKNKESLLPKLLKGLSIQAGSSNPMKMRFCLHVFITKVCLRLVKILLKYMIFHQVPILILLLGFFGLLLCSLL